MQTPDGKDDHPRVRAVVGRRRAARRARAARLHRQPAVACGAWPRRSPPPGFAVELPLLPGHGTSVDDMIDDRLGRLVGGGRGRLRRPGRAGRPGGRGRPVDGRVAHGLAGQPPPRDRRHRVRQPRRLGAAPRWSTALAGDGRRRHRPHPRHRRRRRRPRPAGEGLRRHPARAAAQPGRGRRRVPRRPGQDRLPGAAHDQPAGPRGRAREQRHPGRAASADRSSGSRSSAATTSPRSTTTRTSSTSGRSSSPARSPRADARSLDLRVRSRVMPPTSQVKVPDCSCRPLGRVDAAWLSSDARARRPGIGAGPAVDLQGEGFAVGGQRRRARQRADQACRRLGGGERELAEARPSRRRARVPQ